MSIYNLKIVTPYGLFFEGEVSKIIARTTSGNIAILKNHIPYLTSLSIGTLCIFDADNKEKICALGGGVLSVNRGLTTIIANSCEYKENIDVSRAVHAKERAESLLESEKSQKEFDLASAKLKRAINRINIAK